MNKKINICFVIPPSFPVPAVKGGAIEGLVTGLIKENRAEENLVFHVITKYDEEAEAYANKCNYENVKFIYIHSKQLIEFISRFIFRVMFHLFNVRGNKIFSYYRQLHRILKEKKFDFVIAEGGDYLEIRKCAENYGNEQMILHLHHHYEPDDEIAASYGNIIGVSEYVTQEYMKNPLSENTKSFVLRNTINTSKFSKRLSKEEIRRLRQNLGFRQDDFVVLYIGRIIDVKGVLELIESILKIEDKSVKLLIIGSANFSVNTYTDYEKKVQEYADKNSDRIKKIGYIKNDELYSMMSIANIQCVPSLCEEAAGLVVLEAMAMGLPTIVTDSGGMVEYVTRDTSIVVQREYLDLELRQAVLKLKNDYELRNSMKKSSLEYVKYVSEKVYYNEFCKIIQSLYKVM